MPRVCIIGAGIAGLAAAYRLQKHGYQIDILEADSRAGGRVETVVAQGYQVDTGATALAARYPVATELARELGLDILYTSPYLGIYRRGKIHLIRVDRILRSALFTPLLSWSTKLKMVRLAIDIIKAKAKGQLTYEDLRAAAPLDIESAQHYVERLAGKEADQFFGEPITRALLLANSDQVSRVELMSGLINAVAGRLSTVPGGQASIIERLVERLPPIHYHSPATAIRTTEQGIEVTYNNAQGESQTRLADACVVATQLPVAAKLCPSNSALQHLEQKLTFTRAINVAIGTTRATETPAFLLQLPRSEDAEIAMIILEHNKASDRAPRGHSLLTVSWEMSAADQWFDRSDDKIIERSLDTVFRVLPELKGTVDFTFAKRWPIALPHTRNGVYQAIGDFTATIDPQSPIQFAGDYLSQTGQNTSVAWGYTAAENIIGLYS